MFRQISMFLLFYFFKVFHEELKLKYVCRYFTCLGVFSPSVSFPLYIHNIFRDTCCIAALLPPFIRL